MLKTNFGKFSGEERTTNFGKLSGEERMDRSVNLASQWEAQLTYGCGSRLTAPYKKGWRVMFLGQHFYLATTTLTFLT
jgi:hypothetical protein